MGQAIVIASGKGGTGKTTLAGGLSSCLAALGHRVVCVDADTGLRNLDIVLGLADRAVMDFGDVLSGATPLPEALTAQPNIPGLFLLSAPSAPVAVDAKAFACMIEELENHFDYVVVDAPAGVGEGFQTAVGACRRAILISHLEQTALRDAAATVELLEGLGVAQIQLVLNRVRPQFVRHRLAMNVDDAMDVTGLPIVGLVPEDEHVITAANMGVPLVLQGPTPAARACLHIARRLLGRQVPLLKFK